MGLRTLLALPSVEKWTHRIKVPAALSMPDSCGRSRPGASVRVSDSIAADFLGGSATDGVADQVRTPDPAVR